MSVAFWLLASVFVVAVLVLEGVLVYSRDRKWRELEASFGTSGTGWPMAAAEAGAKVKRPVGEIKKYVAWPASVRRTQTLRKRGV